MSDNGNNSNGRHNGTQPHDVEAYFHRLAQVIPDLPYEAIDRIVAVILRAFNEERTIFVFGNGGSAASASHLMCDLNKGFHDAADNQRFKVMALTDNIPLITAWANDTGYEQVFSGQLKNFVQPRDVAFAISCSGDSPNVLRGLKTARDLGAFTVGVAGFLGGKMLPLCDVCAVVPSDDMQMIEDMHHAILHSIFTVVRKKRGAAQAIAANVVRFSR